MEDFPQGDELAAVRTHRDLDALVEVLLVALAQRVDEPLGGGGVDLAVQ